MTARAPWLRAFTSDRDSTFFQDELPSAIALADMQTAEAVRAEIRAELTGIRDVLDDGDYETIDSTDPSEPSEAIATVKPASVFECARWIAAGILIAWFAWMVMNAARTAPGPG